MDTKDINIVVEDYTVFMTVGPSHAGKSTMAKQLQLELAKANIDCKLLSSDDIRRDLTGNSNMNKYDNRMMEVSAQAFNLLYAKLKNYISYPVNTKTVIIDSTGLNEQFREDIINICRDNNYKLVCILFSYKDRSDWFKFDGGNKFVINKHLLKMEKSVYKSIKAKDYHQVIRIEKPVNNVTVTYIEDKNNLVVEGNDYTVIGDVHGCVDELKELVSKIENTPILVGDWLDSKNDNVSCNAVIIDYLLDNPQILTIKGNHEENLYKHIDSLTEDKLSNKFFNSRQLIHDFPEYKEKFMELYNRSYTSIRGDGFIVTHVPCKSKYLLTDTNKMTNLHYTDENKCDLINSIYDKKFYNNCWPLHLWGHLTFDKPVNKRVSIGLDTGVGYGGVLTAYNVATKKFITINSKLDDNNKQLDNISKFKYEVEDLQVKLDDDETRRLNSFIRNKTPYISGTMCPADKTINNLENVTTVLDYYKFKGQTKVLIQPKYMGSRAQVLVTRQEYEVFTRNGFKLKHTEELDKAVNDLENSVSNEFMTWINSLDDYSSVLLDCELMPWSYLGKGLIEEIYEPYYYSHKTHIEGMIRYGVYNDLNTYKSSDNFINKVKSSNKDNDVINQWKELGDRTELEQFGLELDKYKSREKPYFIPFNILKVESEDGILYSNSDFNKFNNKELLSLLNTPLHEVDIDNIEEVKRVQSLYGHLEGIVIKPYYNVESQAPYIKVRNKDYLRLVYGHNYTNYLDKFIAKKGISNKLRLSVKEWELGNKLLDIHSSCHIEDNKEYINTLIKLMFELNKEKGLDPRL